VATRELAPLPAMAAPGLAVDLHGRGPASHEVLAALRPARMLNFAVPGDVRYSAGPPWYAGEHEVRRWCRLVDTVGAACDPEDLLLPGASHGQGSDGPVLLHPGAASGARRWPAGRWAIVADRLVRSGHQVVVTGNSAERALCDRICAATGHRAPELEVLSGALDLPGLSRTISAARLVICGDTGVAHLATALRVQSVLLFGPTPPSEWGPLIDGDLHTVLWPAPETYRGNPHGHQIDPVLARISPDDVLIAAESAMGTAGGAPARDPAALAPPEQERLQSR
jgi:hypothetical protein